MTALITGGSKGIGLEIVKILLNKNFLVFSISRSLNKVIQDPNLNEIICDISDIEKFEKVLKDIEKNSDLDLYINCAGVGVFGMHEDLKPKDLKKLIDTNLTAPIIGCNILLKNLKKNSGIIINITSISGKIPAKFGGAYGATKAGLEHFGKSLFDEVRKSGVKVVNIAPDMTNTNFFDNLTFRPDDVEGAYIDPKTIGDCVEFILSLPKNSVVTEFTIRPQKILIKKGKS